MAISLIAYAKADIRTAYSALEAVYAKEGNEKAMKGIAAYHAQQAIEKILKSEIYRISPAINSRKMYTHKIYDLCAIAQMNQIKVPKDIVEKAMYTAIGKLPVDMTCIFQFG
ncbi:MAG: hypothetical protein NC400_05040 [Clostridium sp.]|nr:hypothetical protein [Clostridium sp.]